ncbi:hypothetical protein TCSYLVIO_000255, partial [Trypanosoma cruzi]
SPLTLAAMPCRNHSQRETRKSVWMCAESTATVIVRGGHRGTVRHASAHKEQHTHPQSKINEERRKEWSQEQATSHMAGIVQPRHHFSTRRKPYPAVAKAFLQSGVQILIFCVLKKQEKQGKKEAQEGKSIQQEAQLDGSDTCGTTPISTETVGRSTHTHRRKRKQKKNTAAGCGCVCGAAGVCQPWPQKENKTRGKEMCAPPHRPSSHAHTSRLPQRA